MPDIVIPELEQPVVSPFIELFTLDTTSIGGTVYNFTPSKPGTGEYIQFNGVQYAWIPIEFSGLDYSSNGQLPRPTVRISNVTKALLGAVISLGDLVGAKFTRTRTFAKFLDGEPEANPNQHLPKETFFVGSKKTHNKHIMEFELVTAFERAQIMIPKEQATRKNFPGLGLARNV